jgi:hypothetical protein
MMIIVIMITITMMFILTAGYGDVALRKFFNFSLGFFFVRNGFALFRRDDLKPQGAPYLVRIIAGIFYSSGTVSVISVSTRYLKKSFGPKNNAF